MDIIDRIIELTEDIRFRNNISSVIINTDYYNTVLKFIEFNNIDDLLEFRIMLLKYGYLTNISVDTIKHIGKMGNYPMYIKIEEALRSVNKKYGKQFTINIAIYNKAFKEEYSNHYDMDIYDIKEVMYGWI